MSTTIDERVVEMRFDNRHFEDNVKTSMSTLDKLKQKLNLSGASKGLENVGTAAKNVNMSGLSGAVETVTARFSALQVMGVTALTNITNSAINTGKRMISALTVQPVTTGFSEYETKINAVQTIMSNVASKGKTMEDVARVLNELNVYADKTIYNFAEMTRNIGTFTAAGVGLEESAAAIQGLSNLAATTGSTSQQAANAMYQLSQALSTGTVRLTDWNSVANASMGGEKFQEALKQTAREYGIAVDDIIEKSGSFRDSLREEWLSADILNTTLKKFTVEGAKEYAESMVKAGKYTQEQADALIKEAEAMNDAATKVKTYTQLWDTLKESAQSGWAQTWELIFGNFEEAKEFFSGLSKTLGGIIEAASDARNKLLGGALGSKWESFTTKINEAGIATDKFEAKLKQTAKENNISIDKLIEEHGSLANAVKAGAIPTNIFIKTLKKFTGASAKAGDSAEELNDKLSYFQKVVDDVWRGDYGDGEERVKALTDAGYEYAEVQNLVNKTIDGHKLTLEDLSDAELENIGYTEKEIEAIRKLAKEAEKSGTPINELINDLNKPSGRELLLGSITNIIQGVIKACGALKNAWFDIFPAPTSEKLYKVIEGIHSFTSYLNISEDTAKKLQSTFRGVFALLDIIATIVAGPIKIAFKVLSAILEVTGYSLLDLTAFLGEGLVKLRDWVDKVVDFKGIIEKILPSIKEFTTGIKDWVAGIKEADNIPLYIIQGLVNGLKNGASKIIDGIVALGKILIDKFKSLLGIHSPSTVFFEFGGNIIQGLANGLVDGLSILWRGIKVVANAIIGYFKDVDIGQVIVTAMFAGMMYTVIKIANAVGNLVSPLAGLSDMLEEVGDAAKMLSKGLKNFLDAKSFEVRSRAMINMAIAVGILAASVYALSKLKPAELWSTVGALAALAAVITAMTFVVSRLGEYEENDDGKKVLKSYKMVGALLGIASVLILAAIALRILAGIDLADVPTILLTLGAAIGGIAAILVVLGKFSQGKADESINAAGKMLTKISLTLLLMVAVIKMASKLKLSDILKGTVVIVAIGALMVALMAASQLAGRHASKAGGMLLKMSLALLVAIAVIKLAGKLEPEEIVKGIFVIGILSALFAALIAVSYLAGKNASKAGLMLFLMSGAFLAAIAVIKLASMMEPEEVVKGIGVMAAISLLFAAIVTVSIFAGKHAHKAGIMFLAMSGAILLLVGSLFLLSKFDSDGLKRATATISAILVLFAGIIAVSHFAKDVKGTVVALSIAIGLMTIALMALTFIDAKKLMTSVAALTTVMLAFAAMLYTLKSFKNKGAKMLPVIITMGAIAALLAGLVVGLSFVDGNKALPSVAALSLLLLSMSASMLILKKAGGLAMSSIGSLALMGLVVAELAIILGIMSGLGVEASIETAGALSALLLAMSAALVILNFVTPNAMAGIGALAVLGLVVAELAIILGLMGHFDVEPSIETAKSLSLLLVSMSAALVLLGVVGLMGPAAFIGIAALATLIAAIGGLIVGIGALSDKFPQLEVFLDKGIPILEKIGHALGSFFGNIVGGFLGGMSSGFVDIADNLSAFMEHLQPFLDGARNIDATAMEGVKSLATAILILTAAEVLNGMTRWITGGVSLDSFGEQLPGLARHLKDFVSKLDGFDENDAKTIGFAGDALKAIAEAARKIPNEGGLLGRLVGENGIGKFVKELPNVGTDLKSFAGNLQGFSESDANTVKFAGDALENISKAAKKIPNEGGTWASIFGDNGLSKYADKLPTVGTNLKTFATNLDGFSLADATSAGFAAQAIKLMADAGKDINTQTSFGKALFGDNSIATYSENMPSIGTNLGEFARNLGEFSMGQVASVTCGVLALTNMIKAADGINAQTAVGKAIFGDNSIATFCEDLPTIGTNLSSFATNLGEFSAGQVTTITCAMSALSRIIEIGKTINAQSGFGEWLNGDNSIDKFTDKLPDVGTDLSDFAGKVGSIDEQKAGSVDKAVRIINTFASLPAASLSEVGDGLGSFGSAMVQLGTDMSTFVTNMPTSESFEVALTNAQTIIDSVGEVSKINASAVKEFADTLTAFTDTTNRFLHSMSTAASDGVDTFVAAITASASIESAKNAGSGLVNAVLEGVQLKAKNFKTAFVDTVTAAIEAIENEHRGFYNAGSYLVDGFCAGIDENTWKAEAEAAAMANAAEAAAKAALNINSPSKVFAAIGSGVVEGFVKGIHDNESDSTTATTRMANNVTRGFSDAIRKVSDLLDGDMDIQPTIRPVLDLSNVRSGAGSISSILNSRHSVGAVAAGSISMMMAQRGQNGANYDVVSAIRDLRKDFDKLGNTTYAINGITYDDGSNMANAIATIVREARMERRR